MTAVRRLAPFLCVLGLLVAGCGGPTRDDTIKARNDDEFDSWVADHSAVFSTDEVKEINDARQQIKFQVMTEFPNAPADAFADAVYKKISGHTAHDLLVSGYLLLIDREKVTLANYDTEVRKLQGYIDNRRIDEDRRAGFSENLLRVQQQVRDHHTKLEQYEKRLNELQHQQPAAKP